jgi:hypothetical protein
MEPISLMIHCSQDNGQASHMDTLIGGPTVQLSIWWYGWYGCARVTLA